MGEACMAIFWPIPGLKWRTFVTVPGFQVGTWISKSVCMGKEWSQLLNQHLYNINQNKSQNVHKCVEYLAHLPIYLHHSLQYHVQLTYPFIFTKLHVHPHNYFPKNKHIHSYIYIYIYWSIQVHLHADLVYLFISITGIVAKPIPIYSTTSLVNKLETPIHTHTHMYVIKTCKWWKHKFGYKSIYTGLCGQLGKEWLSPWQVLFVLKLNFWILTNNH